MSAQVQYIGRAKPYHSPKKYRPRAMSGLAIQASIRSEQDEYRKVMGRDCDAGKPKPSDFDMPEPPDDSLDVQGPEWEAYFAAHDEWRKSEQYVAYGIAIAKAEERKRQFTYSPRKRNRHEVLASAEVSNATL